MKTKLFLLMLLVVFSIYVFPVYAECLDKDECSLFATQCVENKSGYQICGVPDADDCLKWADFISCEENLICENGECVTPSVPPLPNGGGGGNGGGGINTTNYTTPSNQTYLNYTYEQKKNQTEPEPNVAEKKLPIWLIVVIPLFIILIAVVLILYFILRRKNKETEQISNPDLNKF